MKKEPEKESNPKDETQKPVFAAAKALTFTESAQEAIKRISESSEAIKKGFDFTNFNSLSKYLTSDFNNVIKLNEFDTNIDFNKINAFSNSSIENQLKLSDEINDLRRKLKNTVTELNEANTDKQQKVREFEELKQELTAKEKINHILSRISEDARQRLLSSHEFQALFENSSKCDTVVVSIDIRRSTELMLKARKPELFSRFITQLSFKLSQVIISNFGIFDKFTGDGILAFFPKFYSGNEAIIRAVKAAQECHSVFKEHYINSKDCFNVFIKDVGLGIGIDYGNVTLVNTQSELTVVGIPVVYACRFSGAKAGETLLNQPALEEIVTLCRKYITVTETEIFIKNEGTAIGYQVLLNDVAFDIKNPDWDELTAQFSLGQSNLESIVASENEGT